MTIVNGYCTLAEIKSPNVLNISSTAYDTELENIITATSRAIDNECARYFYKSTADEIRYFTSRSNERLFVGDVVSVTRVYTDTLAGDRTYPFQWSSTDYDLYPYDAGVYSEKEPYRWIDKTPQGIYQFPVNLARGVKVEAIFGWYAVPQAIQRACLLWSERMFKRYQTPLGVSASTALGEMQVKVPPPDPDVQQVLSNYRMVAV